MPVAITRLTAPAFFLFLSFSAAFYRGVVQKCKNNSLFRAQPIVDKEKRLMKYYATRKYMPAHAALPLIRTRENRPFQSQGARWTTNSAMQRYIVSISSFRRPDLGSEIFAPSLAPCHFHPLSRPLSFLFTVRSYLMYDTPLRRRPNRTNTRLVFGTDHSPLSLPICLRPGTSRRNSIRGPGSLLTQRYVFVPRMKKILRNSFTEMRKIRNRRNTNR